MNVTVGFTKENTGSIKGLLAVIVLLHHIIGRVNIVSSRLLLMVIGAMGYWAVACFFFISGYGLRKSIENNRESYIKSFPKRRLLPFALTIGFYLIIYLIYYRLFDPSIQITVVSAVNTFFGGHSVIANGWYLQVQMYLYLLFYIASLFDRVDRFNSIIICVAVAIYYILGLTLSLSLHVYITVPLFIVGLLFAKYESHIQMKFFKSRISLIICAVMFAALFVLRYIASKKGLILASNLLITIESAAFVFVVFALMRYKGICRVLATKPLMWLGKISLSLYAIHGLFIMLYRGSVINIQNDYLFLFLIIASSVLFASLATPVVELIYARCRD